MSFLSDYTEKNSNLIPQIDIPCFAWNSQAEQGFLFFKAKSLLFQMVAFFIVTGNRDSLLSLASIVVKSQSDFATMGQ